MTNPLIALYFISAGILCLAAGGTVLLASGSRAKIAYRLLALICLCFSCVQVLAAIQYESVDVTAVMAAHKWLNLFSILVVPLASCLLVVLEGPQAWRWVPVLLGIGSAVLGTANLLMPYGYRFAQLLPELRSQMPWGEQVSMLSGIPSQAQMLMQLLLFGLGIQLAWLAWRMYQQRKILFSRFLCLTITLLLLTSILSIYTDVGVFRMPYLGGFAFALLVSMTLPIVRSYDAGRARLTHHMRNMMDQEIHDHGKSLVRASDAAHLDALIGLNNRVGMLFDLTQQNLSGLKGAMLCLDLDRFDVVGGTRGDGTRDQLMIAVARRILRLTGPTDMLARVGNNRFAIFSRKATSAGQAIALYEQLALAFLAPFPIADASLMINISVGIALSRQDGTWAEVTPERLLEAAEMALHEARASSGNTYCLYHPELEQTLQDAAAFENALVMALEQKDFSLYFQPQVSAQDERPVCVEALLRWQHPEHGFIDPGKFISVAESMGIIGSLGAWVIESACEQLARLRAAGHEHIRIAINVSTQQLMLPDLEQDLRNCIARFALDPSAIELEVTESLVMRMPELAIARLQALRDMGLRLAIDDFGTGYSSLTYLQTLPVHALKLDRSFIPGINDSQRALSICRNAIQMGRDLGLEVVAEGVETAHQAQALRELGCNLLQGYHYAMPLSPEALLTYLAAWPISAKGADTALPLSG